MTRMPTKPWQSKPQTAQLRIYREKVNRWEERETDPLHQDPHHCDCGKPKRVTDVMCRQCEDPNGFENDQWYAETLETWTDTDYWDYIDHKYQSEWNPGVVATLSPNDQARFGI